MPVVTPEGFWSLYKQEIKNLGSWSAYQKTSSWTPIAKLAAESACQTLGLRTEREYFNIDVIAWTGTWNGQERGFVCQTAGLEPERTKGVDGFAFATLGHGALIYLTQ